MSGNKRRPDRELNHENWDDEEEPVEQGVFQQASVEQMGQRKILKANRRLNNQESGPSLNPFSSIAFNFGAPITASSSPPVLAQADSVTSATSDDSNSGEASVKVIPDLSNEVDSSSSLPSHNNGGASAPARDSMDGQAATASSSSGLNDSIEPAAVGTNGDLRQQQRSAGANANEEGSSEADACSTDSLQEGRLHSNSRYEGTSQEDDEIASSSNNADADNEDSSNDRYYRDGDGDVAGEADAEDSSSAHAQAGDLENDYEDSRNGDDIDSTVQEQEENE